MSVSVKYKNTQIANITETATRTLKTGGKYCEGDIVIENTKDSGGGGGGSELILSPIDLSVNSICTDVIENHIVSDIWHPSVTAVEEPAE